MTACRRFHRLLRAANRSILSVSVLLVLYPACASILIMLATVLLAGPVTTVA